MSSETTLYIHFVVLDGAKRKSTEGSGSGAAENGFSRMAKKIKGRGALTAAGTLVTKLTKEKGGGKPEKKGLATTVSTVSMLKKKFVEDDFDDDFDEEEEFDDLASDEGEFYAGLVEALKNW